MMMLFDDCMYSHIYRYSGQLNDDLANLIIVRHIVHKKLESTKGKPVRIKDECLIEFWKANEEKDTAIYQYYTRHRDFFKQVALIIPPYHLHVYKTQQRYAKQLFDSWVEVVTDGDGEGFCGHDFVQYVEFDSYIEKFICQLVVQRIQQQPQPSSSVSLSSSDSSSTSSSSNLEMPPKKKKGAPTKGKIHMHQTIKIYCLVFVEYLFLCFRLLSGSNKAICKNYDTVYKHVYKHL